MPTLGSGFISLNAAPLNQNAHKNLLLLWVLLRGSQTESFFSDNPVSFLLVTPRISKQHFFF